jgi:hypothetical protein
VKIFQPLSCCPRLRLRRFGFAAGGKPRQQRQAKQQSRNTFLRHDNRLSVS